MIREYGFEEELDASLASDSPKLREKIRKAVERITGVPCLEVTLGPKPRRGNDDGVDYRARCMIFGWLNIDWKKRRLRDDCQNVNTQWRNPDDPELAVETFSRITNYVIKPGWSFDDSKKTHLYYYSFDEDITEKDFIFWKALLHSAVRQNLQKWIHEDGYSLWTQKTPDWEGCGRYHSQCLTVPASVLTAAMWAPEMPNELMDPIDELPMSIWLQKVTGTTKLPAETGALF